MTTKETQKPDVPTIPPGQDVRIEPPSWVHMVDQLLPAVETFHTRLAVEPVRDSAVWYWASNEGIMSGVPAWPKAASTTDEVEAEFTDAEMNVLGAWLDVIESACATTNQELAELTEQVEHLSDRLESLEQSKDSP